jgi:hypothetical protein
MSNIISGPESIAMNNIRVISAIDFISMLNIISGTDSYGHA